MNGAGATPYWPLPLGFGTEAYDASTSTTRGTT